MKEESAKKGVAPFAGAWIETYDQRCMQNIVKSLPSRERGLKHIVNRINQRLHGRRSLRGSVD